MRKHSVRKFIHAILDLLPLMVIPIFAIYSQNHEINDNNVQIEVNKEVNFNQLIENGNFENNYGWSTYNATLNTSNNIGTFKATNTNGTLGKNFQTSENHKYIGSFNVLLQSSTNGLRYQIIYGNTFIVNQVLNNITTLQKITFEFTSPNGQLLYRFQDGSTILNDIEISNVMIFDTTYMFGVGNEPTLLEFEQLFTDDYYNYTLSESIYISDYVETYSDTDIMSQFMYVTYNACDKYFNMNNVFNLHGIWNWVSNTLFGGQPPISAFIVYNVIAYEFIMDIIFLIYMVLMFVIDFAESGIDRFMKRGCR